MQTQVFKWSVGWFLIVSLLATLLLVPILQAKAATSVLFQQNSMRVQQDKSFSTTTNALSYSDLVFSFNYDSTALDGFSSSTGQDNFTYGWQVGSDEHVLGTVLGLAGTPDTEIGVVNVSLPAEASVADLILFVKVTANSTSTSDKVELTNITLTGTLNEVNVPIDVCLNIDDVQTEIPAGYKTDDAGNCSLIAVPPTDICLNLDGIQTEVPSLYEVDNLGNCSLIPEPSSTSTPPVVVDLCLNLYGVQENMPAGYEQGADNTCQLIPVEIIDLCLNIDGTQASVPAGYEIVGGGNCSQIIITPIDVCSNLNGIQTELPQNYKHNELGQCVTVDLRHHFFKSKSFVCPRGYARWMDRLSNGNIWKADDIYESVILVADDKEKGYKNLNNQKYTHIAGPTEVGDRYYHRFHKLSYVCVK